MSARTGDRELGIHASITRRDFFDSAALGAGAVLLQGLMPRELLAASRSAAGRDWDGYGGVGDYARSHGNSYEMVNIGHRVRDGEFNAQPTSARDDEDVFDLVIVGGGLSGLAAAHRFAQQHPGRSCLLLENHLVPGGEAKRNEFRVGGHLLTGPQGSNSFPVPGQPGTPAYEIYEELGVPRQFEYVSMHAAAGRTLQFCRDNFEFQYWKDKSPSYGWHFDARGPQQPARWERDIWSRALDGTPLDSEQRRRLLAWRSSAAPNRERADFGAWLDSMTYKELIENVLGLGPEVTRYVDPIVAAACSGLGCDVTSAYAAYQIAMPGLRKVEEMERIDRTEQHSFPGGNDGFTRYFLKALLPEAIAGGRSFEEIMNGSIRFEALDRAGAPLRLRLGATVVRVEHAGSHDNAEHVLLTYVHGKELRRVRARGVVMAGGSWITRHIVRDLPDEYVAAYQQFNRAPLLVVNVALRNWRFMHEIGVTACRWFEGFGYSCNIRPPMRVGRKVAPLDPDRPAVLTFYVPLLFPGGSIREQAAQGRAELLATSFIEYERRLRRQMQHLFGSAGFKQRDIAAIVLNRWGHAYLCPQPGFYFGREGEPAPRAVIRNAFGRIAFAHSELNGQQNYMAAIAEGRRAADQVAERV